MIKKLYNTMFKIHERGIRFPRDPPQCLIIFTNISTSEQKMLVMLDINNRKKKVIFSDNGKGAKFTIWI